jgi:Tol biopolymer transport system component
LVDTIRPDGTGKKVLAQGYGPSWSPDGTHIVFLRSISPQQTAIFTMRADGSDVRRLTHSEFSEFAASYSPSGRRILFARRTSNPNQLVIATMRVDGSDERVLARGQQLRPFEYSPSGGRIVYADGCGMWDMSSDGSHKRQLVSPESGCNNVSADYSTDGTHISFFHNGEPYIMRSDGSHLHRLGEGTQGPAIYSPNGRRLAWDGHVGPPRSARGDIFVSNLRCKDSVRITHEPDGAAPAGWQPLP